MPKNPLPALAVLFYLLSFPFSAFADDQPLTPASSTPVTSNASPQDTDDSAVFQLDDSKMEKTLTEQEVILRKLIAGHRNDQQKEHTQNTEKTYREALSLYKQKRNLKAREALATVENSMADYKSTLRISKIIDNLFFQKLHLEMSGVNQIKDMPVVDDLSQQAADLYQQTSALTADDNNIVFLKDKMAKVVQALSKLKQSNNEKLVHTEADIFTQHKLDQIAQQADHFDQDVSRLAQRENYDATRSKLLEFQNTMISDLENLKRSLAKSNYTKASPAIMTADQQELLHDKAYRREADYIFRQGIELYRQGNYLEAKSIFLELASQGDRRAKAYLRKADHLIQEDEKRMEHH